MYILTRIFPTCASLFLHFYIFIYSDEPHTETVKRVLREYHNRITALEDKKFDIEYVVKKKDFEVLLREQQLQERLRENVYVQNDNNRDARDTVNEKCAMLHLCNAEIFVQLHICVGRRRT